MDRTIDRIKQVIKENYEQADCGLFFTRNIVGDPMYVIYEEDGIRVEICYRYSYFEVFGVGDVEKAELVKFYYSLKGD